MSRKPKDPISIFFSIHHTAAVITGAFTAMLLVVLLPVLQPYRKWIVLVGTVLGITLGYLWFMRTPEFPVWYFPALRWAAWGNMLFFLSRAAQLVLEIWFDLTPYQMAIDLVSFACPLILGILGALKHKDDYFEEDNNNG